MERETGRLIVSPHATRRKREVVVVHGEVSRFGEDLTSRDRRSCPTRCGSGCRCSAVPTEPPKDSTPYPGLACPASLAVYLAVCVCPTATGSATSAARVRLGSKARPTASSSVASAHVKRRSCADWATDVEPTIWDLGGDMAQREIETTMRVENVERERMSSVPLLLARRDRLGSG